jgi:hypothetical protein
MNQEKLDIARSFGLQIAEEMEKASFSGEMVRVAIDTIRDAYMQRMECEIEKMMKQAKLYRSEIEFLQIRNEYPVDHHVTHDTPGKYEPKFAKKRD